jgi:cytochrome c oxidase subunit 4
MSSQNEAIREEHKTHEAGIGRYFVVYILLLILTFGTFGVAHFDLGEWNLVAAIGIACCKATLVVLFFMHLWDSEGANRAVFAVSCIFVLVLLFFVMEDTVHRFPLTNPRPETTVNLPGGNPVYGPGAQHIAAGTAAHPTPEHGQP